MTTPLSQEEAERLARKHAREQRTSACDASTGTPGPGNSTPMKIDWLAKLRHMLQVLAFCLAVSAIQFAFSQDRPYEVPLVYSVFIGMSIWLFIDMGRHLVPSAAATGWPQGWAGMALPLVGIVGGYGLGTLGADSWFGWSSWDAGLSWTDLRSGVLITVLAGVAGSYYFHSLGKSAYLQRKMIEAQQHASEARLRLLESQLEPHMLFNTLANLRALIASDPPRATAMLDRIIDYLRATLAASRATMHPLQAEFDRLRDYLELMTVRMGPRLRYTLDLPDDLAQLPVPTLLLQPLVENSIRHGLEPQVEGGSITVRARCDGQQLTLEVIDTGVGMAGASHAGGFGLTQVRERLATVYGQQAASISIADGEGGGVHARVTLPWSP